MSVEDEFRDTNFFRQTSRAVSARVLAHLLAPQISKMFSLHGSHQRIVALNDQGWSNFTLAISCEGSPKEYILRLSDKSTSAHAHGCRSVPHFEKEHAILSRLQGHPFVPAIIADGIGTLNVEVPGRGQRTFAFMVEERLPFNSARGHGALSNHTRALEQLGELCRLIHAVPCEGFGIDFDASLGRFSCSSFQEFVESKIRNIKESPISHAMKRWLEVRAEGLLALTPEPKLFHRDLLGNPGNYLVDDEHNVRGIIDWEFAGSGAAFHYEIASMLYVLARDGHSAERIDHDLHAVLRGYGMSLSEYHDYYEKEVETIVLMNSISAILKYSELEKRGNVDQEPWRKVFAERATAACEVSFARDSVAPRPSTTDKLRDPQ